MPDLLGHPVSRRDCRSGPAMTKKAGNDKKKPAEKAKGADRKVRAFSFPWRKKLFLSALVSLVEHINSSGGIDDLGFAGVERVRRIRNLDLHERVGDTFDLEGLLGVHAGARDEHYLV